MIELPALEPPATYKALGGVAVIADSSWAALKARDLLSVEWEDGVNADYESDAFKQALLKAVREPGASQRDEGNFDDAHAAAATTLEAEYYAPHLGHMMMEPPAAVANVTADFCEVWAPSQDPQSLVGMATAISGLPEDKVRINMTLLGSAFGRKGKGDYVAEALIFRNRPGSRYCCNGAARTRFATVITTRSAPSSCQPGWMKTARSRPGATAWPTPASCRPLTRR